VEESESDPDKERAMGYLLNVGEIIGFAVNIEKSGYEFYVEAMKRFSDSDIVRLFQYLADEEFKHEKLFQKLRQGLESFNPPESYDGEYQAYMTEFCKTHVLANRDAFLARLKSVSGLNDVLEMALAFEKDSVVFFTELKRIVGGERADALEAVIQEEMAHVRRILQLKMARSAS
jgi:rubrerythrin